MKTGSWNQGIPSGFGLRLKEERKRLGKTQAEFAEAGGVGRLSQIQYENESTAPTTRYLSGIANLGVDLAYLLLGVRLGTGQLTTEQEERIDKKAFELIEAYAEAQPDRRLGAESRRVLYRVLRSCLVQVELGSLPANFDLATLIPGNVANIANIVKA
ncbi:MAG: helix-turn-helix transcriptional regulator [Betaproteobacteria bacterium]|nr:helix-turn-helix transcriptional regulator [Betaproteobacteria bacterium]